MLLSICFCLKRSFSFLRDVEVAGVHSLGCVSSHYHCGIDFGGFNAAEFLNSISIFEIKQPQFYSLHAVRRGQRKIPMELALTTEYKYSSGIQSSAEQNN